MQRPLTASFTSGRLTSTSARPQCGQCSAVRPVCSQTASNKVGAAHHCIGCTAPGRPRCAAGGRRSTARAPSGTPADLRGRAFERWRAVTCACPCLAASLGVRSPDASQHTHSSTGRHSAACCRHGARPRTCIAEVSASSQLVFLSYCCAAPSLLRPLHGAQQQQHWQSYPALSCILLYGWHDKRVAAEQGLSPVSSCLAALCVCSVACCAGQGLETSLAVGPYLIGRQAGVLQEEGFLAAVRLSASCVSTLLAAQLLLLVE